MRVAHSGTGPTQCSLASRPQHEPAWGLIQEGSGLGCLKIADPERKLGVGMRASKARGISDGS